VGNLGTTGNLGTPHCVNILHCIYIFFVALQAVSAEFSFSGV